jgi:hypothetical protein
LATVYPHDGGPVDPVLGRDLGDRHLLANQLQPDLVLLGIGQEPLRTPARAVPPRSDSDIIEIVHDRSEDSADVV